MSQPVNNAMNRLRPLTARHLRARAEMLRAEVYGTLEASRIGRGRVYKRRGRLHQASAEQDPPARDTGALMESIQVVHFDENALVAQVGPSPFTQAFKDRPYPAYLEYGTRRMAPRSYMRRSLETFRRSLQ